MVRLKHRNYSSSDAFLNERILSSDPLWHAINTNMLHLRNDVGMQILTGKGAQGTEGVMYINEQLQNRYFKDARRLQLEGGEDAVRTIGDKPHLITLLQNLNKAWQVTGGATKRARLKIFL